MPTLQRIARPAVHVVFGLILFFSSLAAFGQGALSNGQIVSSSATGYEKPTIIGTFDETQNVAQTVCLALNVTSAPSKQFTPRLEIYESGKPYGGSSYDGTGTHACSRSWSVSGTYTVEVFNSADYPAATGTFDVQFILPGEPFNSGDSGGGLLPAGSPTSGSVSKWFYQLWTFATNANDSVTLTASSISGETSGLSLAFQLYNPSGGEVQTTDNDPASMHFNFAVAGNYTFIAFQNPTNDEADPTTTMTYDVAVTGMSALSEASALYGSHCTCQAATSSSASSLQTVAPARQAAAAGGLQIAVVNAVGASASGDPIDTASGNLYEQEVDYATAGSNPLAFVRYYNSLSQQNNLFPTPLGPNWRSNYDRYLRLNTSILAQAERPDGQVVNFKLVSSVWTPDTDEDYTLTNSGSSWTLTGPDDTVETYSGSSGEAILQAIKLRDGYEMTMNYTSGQLTSVTDSYSRTLTLSYTGATLTGLTTPETLALTYGYTTMGGKSLLTSVTYNTNPGTNKQYLYETNTLPFSLTGITDENGHRYATWTYDDLGRATSSNLGTTLNAGYTQVAYDDSTGNRVVTQPLGEVDTYKFKTLQGIAKISEIDRAADSPVAAATRLFTYDSNGYLATAADWNGNSTHYTNNNHGLQTHVVEGYGSAVARTTSITYDTTWPRLPHVIMTAGLTTTLNYDPSTGNLLTKVRTDTTSSAGTYTAATRTWTYTWSNFLLASITDPRSNATGFTYDASGALTKFTNALGQSVQVTQHTGAGRPQTIVDANGVTAQLTYDARQRLKSSAVQTTTGVLTTMLDYDPAGNLISTTLPDGSSLTNTYDNAYRLTAVTDALGNKATYALDAAGDQTQTTVTDPASTVRHSSAAKFDVLGRLLQSTGGAGQVTQYGYDGNGNATAITDPLDRLTSRFFDPLNRLSQITDPAMGLTAQTYDAHNRLLSVMAPNSALTAYTYDGFGDLIQTASPDTGKAAPCTTRRTGSRRAPATGRFSPNTAMTGSASAFSR